MISETKSGVSATDGCSRFLFSVSSLIHFLLRVESTSIHVRCARFMRKNIKEVMTNAAKKNKQDLEIQNLLLGDFNKTFNFPTRAFIRIFFLLAYCIIISPLSFTVIDATDNYW